MGRTYAWDVCIVFFLALVSSLSLLHFKVIELSMDSLVVASWFFLFF